MYNLPILSQLILLLHWVLVTINDWLASLGLSSDWTWGLAIIGLTIIVRLILFPLTWKQFSSAQAMQAIQPKLKELQKKYKSDRGKLQAETMKLYQEHRVNPFASCLPILLQLPVFIGLYAAIKGLGPLEAPQYQASVEALNQASFLWIPHLGLPDPYYILLVVYVASQLISTELMLVNQTDKSQKMIMRAMPIIFVIFLWKFPAGLFVYWVTTNIWTIGQQLLIRKMMKPPDLEALASRPVKRSRFMEALSSAQGDRMQTREDLIAKQRTERGQKGIESGDAGKSGAKTGGQKSAAKTGAQKAAGTGTQGTAKTGGQTAAKEPSSVQQAQTKKGARKPPPGKGKRKPGTQPAQAGGQPAQPAARPEGQPDVQPDTPSGPGRE